MAYRIRYNSRQPSTLLTGTTLRWQIFAALCLAAAVTGVRVLCRDGAGLIAQVLKPGDGALESATRQMAEVLAAGEGWYEGFAQFCGRIIHGPA